MEPLLTDIITNNIHYHMRKTNLTITELAKIINMPEEKMECILNGENLLTLTDLKRFALYFNVPIEDFLDNSTFYDNCLFEF